MTMQLDVDQIDITGLDKARLLQALFNHATPRGYGVLQDQGPLSREQAEAELASHEYRRGYYSFDYVQGRPIKVKFTGDILDRTDLYDRSHGEGAAASIVQSLRLWAASRELFTPEDGDGDTIHYV